MAGARSGRRRLLRAVVWLVAVAVLALVAVAVSGAVLYVRAQVSTVGELRFANELRIPPLLAPSVDGDGRKLFDLELQEGTSELLPGTSTDTWGANGAYLGPTLRASRGDEVVVRVRNELPEQTTMHWHGMHLPAAADGGPHQPIDPGTTWSPTWSIDQPAATLWYHPHPHRETEEHIYRGLAGLFILDDPQSDALALPKQYGVDDIPVVIQDKRFGDDGALDFSQSVISPAGRLGSTILVNGTFDPFLTVTTRRVRLRLLNASSARVYNVGLADSRMFALVATDGGFLAAPHRTTRLQLSPGERAEIVVELEPRERVVLRSFEPELGTDFFNERFVGGDDTFDLLELRAATVLAASPELPDRFATEQLDAGAATTTRRFELTGSSGINGRSMDMNRLDAVVTIGVTELWEVENSSGTPHNFHVHGVQFQVVSVAGDPPPPELTGPKDTVFVPPGKTASLLVRFTGYADPTTPFMFHCHLLQHEDRGMMGQLVVVNPGDEPALPQETHDHAGPG